MQKGPTRRAARQDMCAASAHISCQDDGRLVVRLSGVHLCLAVCCLVVHVSWCMPTKCAYASCCVFAHVFPCVCVLCACIFLWVPTRCACTHTSCHCLVVLHRSLVGSCTDILLCRAQISCCVVRVSFAKEPYKRDHILQKRPVIVRSLLILSGVARISCCVVHRSLVVSCRAQICAEKCAQHNMRSMLCSRTDLCREMCTTQHENNTTSCKTQQEISEKCAQHNMRTTQHVVLCTFRTTQQRVVHISHRFHVVFCTDLLWCLAYL